MSIKSLLVITTGLLMMLIAVTLYSGGRTNYSELRVEDSESAEVSLEWVALPSLPSGESCWMLRNTYNSPQYEIPVWCSRNNEPKVQ